MANELKRCPNPWCDGLAEVEPHSFLPKTWFVICQDCELDGPQQNTPEKAIGAWNRRTPSPAFVAMKDALETMTATVVLGTHEVEDVDKCGFCAEVLKARAALALAESETK